MAWMLDRVCERTDFLVLQAAAGSSDGLNEPPEKPMQEEREEDQDEGEEANLAASDTAGQAFANCECPT